MYQLRYVLNVILTAVIMFFILKVLIKFLSLDILFTAISLILAIIIIDIGEDTNGTIIIRLTTGVYKLVNFISLKLLGFIVNSKFLRK